MPVLGLDCTRLHTSGTKFEIIQNPSEEEEIRCDDVISKKYKKYKLNKLLIFNFINIKNIIYRTKF